MKSIDIEKFIENISLDDLPVNHEGVPCLEVTPTMMNNIFKTLSFLKIYDICKDGKHMRQFINSREVLKKTNNRIYEKLSDQEKEEIDQELHNMYLRFKGNFIH